MKLFLIQIIYGFLLPPGGIILLLILFNIYGYRKHCKCQPVLTLIILVLYFFSSRIGADFIAGSLERTYPHKEEVSGDVLLMIGRGSFSGVPGIEGAGQPSPVMARSMLVTAELYQKKHLPILVAGGVTFSNSISESDIALREFKNLGVPANKLYGDFNSKNTVENAKNSAVICRENGWTHPILLAEAVHAPRAAIIFRRAGLDVSVYPTNYRRELTHHGSPIFAVIPDANNLNDSAVALKEWLGIFAINVGLQ